MRGGGGVRQSGGALTSKHAGLLSGDLSGMDEVTLVPHKHDNNRGFGMVIQLLQPALHHGVGLVLGQVKYQECPHGSPIVPVWGCRDQRGLSDSALEHRLNA